MNFGTSINNSKYILDYSNTKNNVITNNLSNINNPKYKRKYMNDISFNSELELAMKVTHEKHFTGTENTQNGFKINTEYSQGRNDGNNVNLDKEIVDLTSNQYLFQLNSTVLQKEYSKLREAII